MAPAFVFGHGESYTSFVFSDFNSYAAYNNSRTAVSFTVTNSGKVAGTEVAQLYLGFPAAAGEPPKQLKGFRVLRDLAAGAEARASITLDERSFSTWDVGAHGWRVEQGEFAVWVGGSSDTAEALTGKISPPPKRST